MQSKHNPFEFPKLIEAYYQRQVRRLVDKFYTLPNVDNLEDLVSILVDWKRQLPKWGDLPERIAGRMVTMVDTNVGKGWRDAARESGKSRLMYSLMQREFRQIDKAKIHSRLIYENSLEIKSVPPIVANHLSRYIANRQMQGARANQIASEIQAKCGNLKSWQIQRIARTETAKAHTAIIETRAQSLGLGWYQWETSGDSRVRLSHKFMDKVLIRWDDPPSPELLVGENSTLGHYQAGDCPNCRCTPLPIISLDEIQFPARVYIAGNIVRLTKAQFALRFR